MSIVLSMSNIPKSDIDYTCPATPEQLLMLAIIEQATNDIKYFKDYEIEIIDLSPTAKRCLQSRYNNAREAQKWILDTKRGVETSFSFLWCAMYAFTESMGLDMDSCVTQCKNIASFPLPAINTYLNPVSAYTPSPDRFYLYNAKSKPTKPSLIEDGEYTYNPKTGKLSRKFRSF